MNFQYIICSALLAVTVADLRSHIQPIDDFPHLQKEYPDLKYVVSFGGSRIVGGEEAKPGQFPYQVRQFVITTQYLILCAASVISREYVLTAAHCVDSKNLDVVILVFGAHDLSRKEPEQVGVEVPSVNVIVHPEWDRNTTQNDIALIKLVEPITFTPRIQPVALPTRSQASASFEGEKAFVSGWGRYFSKGESPKELQFVQLPIITNAQCKKIFSIVTATNICADGANGRGTCGGDSGGALVVYKNGKAIQIGIASFFGAPCDAGNPVGFARVTSYLDFIQNNTNIVIAP